MLSRIENKKRVILSTLLMVLLICGAQGVSSVEAAPDLRVGTPTVSPSNVAAGGTFTLSVTVTNEGDTASSAATLIYYRSTDATITTNDAIVGTDPVSQLSPNTGSSSESITLQAPAFAGTYYYGAYVTPVIGETDVLDNITSTGDDLIVTAGANLSVSVVQSSSSVVPGQIFYLNTTVINTGTAASNTIILQAYQRSGITDVPVGAPVTLQPIAGNSRFGPRSIGVTAPTVPGTYVYLVKIVSTTIVSNVTSVTVTNPVDLSVDTPSVEKSTVAPGETFTLSTTVRNIGAGNFTGTTTLRYFRSTDTTLNRTDGTDTEVGTDAISTLSGYSGTIAEDTTVTAPSQPGTYYYFAYVEPVQGERYYSTSITNNTSSYVAVTVSAPPDLTVSLYRLRQATFAPGERFTLEAIVRNEGTGGAAATQLRVYEDEVFREIADRYGREQLITRQSVRAISAGNSSTESIPLTAPPDAGLYYYRVCVDTVTGETETDDNCSNRISIEVLEPLVLASLESSKIALASGESFTLTATVKNDGDARAAATTVQYYRSSNNSLSSSDTRVGSRSVSALAVGGTTQVSIPLSAPQTPGTYYYGACVGDSQTYSGDACAIIKLTVLAVILPQSERPPMYWIDAEAGALQSLTGSRVQRLVQSVQNAAGIAVDAAAGKIYWIEKINNRSGRIRAANLDGTNVRLVASLTSVPTGIAVDVSNKRLYITNGWGKVQRLDVDGRNFRSDLITGLSAPRGIAVDAAGGRIYWTEQTSETTGRLQSANLNGGNVRLVASLTSAPMGIAVDVSNKRLYITNGWGKVQRFDVDGRNFRSDLITGLSAPRGIAVDAAGGRIYWTARGKIQRANLDGTNVQDVVRGVSAPVGIALNVSAGRNAAAAPLAAAMAPNATALHANYPNPFNPETWIPYQLREAADVHISIYDQRGVLVRELSLGHQVAGQYLSRSRAAYWDGRNQVGEPVASGLYFYTLTAGEFTATRKMLIVK